MKVLRLSINGCRPAVPEISTHPVHGKYLRFAHGEDGRGRKLIFFPLGKQDFPAPENLKDGDIVPELAGQDFELLPVSEGRAHILVRAREDDGRQLILWSLSPGYRGGALYWIKGKAHLLKEGYEAQGAAGRMGGAPCPVLVVEGPCVLTWQRTGRLYGSPAKWRAVFEYDRWSVTPDTPEECSVEIAMS